ncbi:MAG: nucleotidyl transferase AbiEii/AbiGii toxin family protein [Planctomycetales bacterium]
MSMRDRADLFAESARRRTMNVVVIEKDFWVCWVLKRLFTMPNLPAGLIFKGGTSLSKVFGVIERFSEDVDLSFNRDDLGFGGENDPAHAGSKKKQQAQVENLVVATSQMIRDKLLPRLMTVIESELKSASGRSWGLELDSTDAEQQTVLFHYPKSDQHRAESAPYLRPNVRLEMGARAEHWPITVGTVQPYAADDVPTAFQNPACTVRAAAAERTFWEKATILHMWHHAGADKTLKERQSRHYYDVVRLFEHPTGKSALNDLELLRAVARHKSLFFRRAWAKFDEAVPGSLRLVPPKARLVELAHDYATMREEMIFGEAPTMEHILDVLAEIERLVNGADGL